MFYKNCEIAENNFLWRYFGNSIYFIRKNKIILLYLNWHLGKIEKFFFTKTFETYDEKWYEAFDYFKGKKKHYYMNELDKFFNVITF